MGIASLGGIGGIKGGGKKPGNSNNKDKGKEESGKQGQTSDNKPNTDKDLISSAIVGQKNLDQLPKNVQDIYIKYSQSDWKGGVSGQSPGTKAGGKYNNDPPSLPTTDKSGNAISYKEYDVNNKLPQEKEMLNDLSVEAMVQYIIQKTIMGHL